MNYFSGLDTIRCYAVMMVMFSHIFKIWTWKDSTVALFPLGQAGVVIFFVLSGFLITRLLIKEPANKSLALCFKEFYIRRSLRIFPIYYLFLIITYSTNIDNVRDYGVSLWVYLTNFFIFNYNGWIGAYSHLWTLSVEEQFYLIWPFLVLFFRKNFRLLLVLFISVILVSIITKIVLLDNGFSNIQIMVFSLSAVDFFALGALTALINIYYNQHLQSARYPLLIIGIFLYYGSYYLFDLFNNPLFFAIQQLALGIFASGLIIAALNFQTKGNLFHNKLTIHLGKISYGIYLYHNTIIAHYADIAAFFGINVGDSIYIKIILSLLFVLSVSELSFFAIEKPILKLKDRFRTTNIINV